MPPYLKSGVGSPYATPLPYMWGPPQSMIPPYGAPPYAVFYAHGGVYAHPGIPVANMALSVETPGKSSGNTDGGFVKKLKEFDGLAISVGNGNANNADRETKHGQSDSEATEGSSDESNGVTATAAQNRKKRSRQGSLNRGDTKRPKESSQASKNMTTENESTNGTLEVKDPALCLKSSPTKGPQTSLPNEAWLQNERELKRERRKQSNRESARRSRLRKQAETEELAAKVQALTAENMTLTSEINKLIETAKKLKLKNAALMEKLRAGPIGNIDDANLQKPDGTVNLLARVNNNKTDRGNDDGDERDDKSPGAKLHQLLDANPRTDSVAAN